MVMGGIPFCLNQLSTGKSVPQLVDELCFSPTGLLADEYEQLYYSLFKNASNHVAIVEVLANHPYGLTRLQLAQKSKIPEGGSLTRALEDLMESGFVLKFQPFQKKQRDSIFRLIDLYSLFYLRFIRDNRNNFTNSWQQLSTESRYTTWSGYAYENICLLHSAQILKKLGISGTITRISSWYFKGNDEIPGAQIDLVIDRKDGLVNLCEAKFSNKEYLLTKEYTTKLRQKRTIFEQVTVTKKTAVTTLITSYPAIQNTYYLEEVHSEVSLDDLFKEI